MLNTVPYTLDELLRERREGAVRALVRAVGYALARGGSAEDVGRFLFESYQLAGEFDRRLRADGSGNGAAFAARHMQSRCGWCDDVLVRRADAGIVVESESMLKDHDSVLSFHGVTRMDMEACMETFWRLSGEAMGLEVTYTVGEEMDWAMIRHPGSVIPSPGELAPSFTNESLAAHRRIALATGITFSIGFAKQNGDEPEELGQFFFEVWDKAGHYGRLHTQYGFGNALAYAQNMARHRQFLYQRTDLVEDLDGYTIVSPSWATEIPQIMGTFGCLPDDVYRYYAGGGVPACARLGLQYADQSEDHTHRVWIRSR